MSQPVHLSDEDLVRFLDGELPAQRAGQCAQHLDHCWECRTRAGKLEQSISSFVQLKHQQIDPQLPHPAGPGALLRARIAQTRPDSLRLKAFLPIAIGAGLAIVFVLSTNTRPGEHLPDNRLTPGATIAISRAQVCAAQSPAEDSRPTPALASAVFRNYRISNPRPGDFEVDFLIDPMLGGAEDIRNLWPQPYKSGVWNARIKDALEDLLRAKVCNGEIDLATAQAEIAQDWVAAYKKHFRTQQPISAHALFIKDKPWE